MISASDPDIMRYPKPTFANGEIYHVYNRGVEKRVIFTETANYIRMLHDLYELNDANYTFNSGHYLEYHPNIVERNGPREPLVEILAFVLMPNHYHLMLRQIQENGVIKFMQKLGIGYAVYFNIKYDRVGPLFQGRFKAVHVTTNRYLQNLLGYIHTNPMDLTDDHRDPMRVMGFLRRYHWSSFMDYAGIENCPEITSRTFLLEVFGGSKEIEKATEDWIKYRPQKIQNVPEIIKIRC